MLAATVRHLARSRDVLAPDARGHGGSDLPDEPFTLAALADDAARVVREVLGRPAVVVGHSMGGLTAQELALRHPDLVLGLVLEDPAWGVLDAVHDEGGRPRSWPRASRRPADARRRSSPRTSAATSRSGRPRSRSRGPAHSWPSRRACSRCPTSGPPGLARGVRRRHPRARRGGRGHPLVPGARRRRGPRERRPGGRGTGRAGRRGGHCVRRDAPAAFLALVDELLAEVDASADRVAP
ncbi:alpha/beta fold hydrolase [Oerskovia sp. M15]